MKKINEMMSKLSHLDSIYVPFVATAGLSNIAGYHKVAIGFFVLTIVAYVLEQTVLKKKT